MTKQQVANGMLRDFPWDGTELATPLTLPGALLAPTYLEQKQIATPTNPPAGSLRLYPKSDGKFYQLDPAGNEMVISGMSQAQSDARYLPLTGGILSGPLTTTNLTAQNVTASGKITADSVVVNTYKWTPEGDGETLWKEMPGRLRLSGAQLTVDTNLNVGTFVQVGEIATPVTPNIGQIRLYGKVDHRVYIKVNSGVEASLLTATEADTHYDPLGIAASGDAAHVAATDPHPVYLTAAEGDTRYASNPGGPSGGYLTVATAAATYLPLVGGTLTGNLTLTANQAFSGASRRIQGDFTGSPASVRTLFQTTVANGLTSLGIIPNGTGTVGEFAVYGASNPDNASRLQIGLDASSSWISSWHTGTGTVLPLVLYTNNVERMRIATDGVVSFAGLATDRIRYATATAGNPITLSFETLEGQATIVGKTTATLVGNAWFDGSAWNRIDNSVPSGVVNVANNGINYYIALAGTGAPAWINKFSIDPNGTITTPSTTISGTSTPGFIGNIRNNDFGIGCRAANFLRIGANSTIAFWANDGAFTNDSPQMSLNSSGNLSVVGSLTSGSLSTGNFAAASATINGQTNIIATTGDGIGTPNGAAAPFMIQAGGPSQGGGAAMMTFHRPGAFAAYFGLDTDNQWAIGGWSMGGVRHIIATLTQTQTMSNKTLSSCSLDGTSTVADGTQHQGWVRVNGQVGIYSSTYGIGLWMPNSTCPQFYAGRNSNEYIQSNARADMTYRYATGGNVTIDQVNLDMIEFNTGSYVYLPDLNTCWGRVFHVKNMTGAAASVYVTNGNGIYSNTWINPFTLQHGDSITVHANQAYSGWIII